MRKKRKSLKAKRPLRYAAAALALALTFVSISAAAFARSDGENAETSGSGDVSAAALALSEEETKSIQILNITGSGAVVAGAVFTLKGTGDDGTYYEESQATDEEGRCAFTVPKAGTYALCQSDVSGASPSVTGDGIVRALHVDEDGTVTLDEKEAASDGSFIITSAAYSSGTVSVIKKWITDNTDALYDDEGAPVLPTVYLSSQNPAVTVTFILGDDAAEFSFTYNSTDYAASDGTLSLRIPSGKTLSDIIAQEEPSLSGYSFSGWYSDSSMSSEFSPYTAITEDITLYALFESTGITTYYLASEANNGYTVCIYGIEESLYSEDGGETTETAGLTFGPAAGIATYTYSVYHEPTGKTASGNEHRCLHDDDWETIIYWSQTDPYVYEQCVQAPATGLNRYSDGYYSSSGDVYTELCNCTKSLGNGSSAYSSIGTGGLGGHLGGSAVYVGYGTNYYYCWNYAEGVTLYSTWKNCQLRANMNGSGVTDDLESENSTGYIVDEGEGLLQSFPDVLQEAIVSAAVYCSTTVYDDREVNAYGSVSSVNDITNSDYVCYDELWAVSVFEYFYYWSSTGEYVSTAFTRQKNFCVSTSDTDTTVIYNYKGEAAYVWTRTQGVSGILRLNKGNGFAETATSSVEVGCSPFFCIK